jgi:hypothetical protein
MKKFLSAAAIAGVIVSASPALSDGSGTMDLMPTGEWAKVMPDKELAETRGGFFSLAFSAMFTVFVENGGNAVANVTAGGAGVSLPSSTQIGVQNGQVQVTAFVGNIQNVQGILNIVQVPGSFNVVNTQLTVQISIFNVLNQAQIPSLQTLFQLR